MDSKPLNIRWIRTVTDQIMYNRIVLVQLSTNNKIKMAQANKTEIFTIREMLTIKRCDN